MNNTPNSGGRKKTVGTGSAGVRKEQKVNTSGPVGREDGYAGKQGPRPSGGGNRASGSGGLGLLGLLLGGGSKRIIVLIVILVAAFLLFRLCTGGCAIPEMSIDESTLGNLLDGDGYDNPSGPSNSGGTSFQAADLIGQFLSDSYNASDETAPETVSATTSSQTPVTTVSNRARDKYTVLRGGGRDTVTLMVYLCGTDLESDNGMGTADLNEMLHAALNDDKVNVIVETGGTRKWRNSVISNSVNQRWRVTSKGMQPLEKDLGRKSMIDPATLSDFIRYAAKNYPADRYALIFWDHGGGSISGYGYDPYYSGSMTLDKVNKALKDGGVKFDFIGFDACLMGTLETALVCEPYADYLIASEEAEPGCGWYYTNWLGQLSKNTSTDTVTLGRTIIDDFNNVCKKNYPGCNTTLSIIDLAEFAATVPEPFAKFSQSVSTLLDNESYKTVADARSGAREFGRSSGVNHVDLVDLSSKIGTAEANALIEALKGCIKYNRTSTSMARSYGLSIYFPYTSFKGMSNAVKIYDSIGMDQSYTDCIRSFSSLAAGGQIATGGTSTSPIGSLLGGYTGSTGFSSSDMLEYLLGGGQEPSSSGSGDLFSGLLGSTLGGGSTQSGGSFDTGSLLSTLLGGSDYSDWFDSGRVLRSAGYYDRNGISIADMLLTEKNGGFVLKLSKEKWAVVENVQLNLFVDDGEGFIDLGLDNVYEFDSDGDLVIDWDGTWLALNGHIVPYYMIDDTTDNGVHTITGRIPAMLNGELVYLMTAFENDEPIILGAQRIYANSETDTVAKGLIPIQNGDVIRFVCDYYDYDGNYSASYTLADPLTVNGPLTLENLRLDADRVVFCYCLSDMYGNEFWTESLTVE